MSNKGKTWSVPNRVVWTEKKVAGLVDQIKSGMTIRDIALIRGVSEHYIRNIIWKKTPGINRILEVKKIGK